MASTMNMKQAQTLVQTCYMNDSREARSVGKKSHCVGYFLRHSVDGDVLNKLCRDIQFLQRIIYTDKTTSHTSEIAHRHSVPGY
jgi:hypothetical protein